MEEKLFDKRFVHFLWDDSLTGRECFFADNIGLLEYRVESNAAEYRSVVYRNEDAEEAGYFPFTVGKVESWEKNVRFVYFDPHYDERVALIRAREGKE